MCCENLFSDDKNKKCFKIKSKMKYSYKNKYFGRLQTTHYAGIFTVDTHVDL